MNPTVGDLAGNRRLVEEAAAKAETERADVVVLPELVLTGYPPLDLLERDGFVRDQLRELDALAPASRRVAIAARRRAAASQAAGPARSRTPRCCWRAAAAWPRRRRRCCRPTTSSTRSATSCRPTRREPVRARRGASVGLTVCEDTWVEPLGYAEDPVGELAPAGAALVLNLVVLALARRQGGRAARHDRGARGTPSRPDRVREPGRRQRRADLRRRLLRRRRARARARARCRSSTPAFGVVELPARLGRLAPGAGARSRRAAQLEAGLVLGIRDYFRKQGLPPGAVIGLSGGVDSAVTAHLAVRALGPERVLGVAMPGPFSSAHSVEDALALGRSLGIEVRARRHPADLRRLPRGLPRALRRARATTGSRSRTSSRASAARS